MKYLGIPDYLLLDARDKQRGAAYLLHVFNPKTDKTLCGRNSAKFERPSALFGREVCKSCKCEWETQPAIRLENFEVVRAEGSKVPTDAYAHNGHKLRSPADGRPSSRIRWSRTERVTTPTPTPSKPKRAPSTSGTSTPVSWETLAPETPPASIDDDEVLVPKLAWPDESLDDLSS